MPRLPHVGGDTGNWGDILNDYLSTSLAADGSLNIGTVGSVQLKPGSITPSHLQPGAIGTPQLADNAVTVAKLSGTGQPNGIATLDSDARVPEAQIPARLSQSELDSAYVSLVGVSPFHITDTAQNGKAGIINWVKDSTTGYLVHLTSGVENPGSGVLGIGVDQKGTIGQIISQKQGVSSTGQRSIGLFIDHQITIDQVGDETSYALYVKQASTKAPAVVFESVFGGSAPLLRLLPKTWGAGQIAMDMLLSDNSTAFQYMADTGEGKFYTGQHFAQSTSTAASMWFGRTGGNRESLHMDRYTGTPTTFYRHVMRLDSNGELVFGNAGIGATIDGSATYNSWLRADRNGVDLRIGFFGSAPVTRPTLPAAGVVTAADIRAALISLGLAT